MVFFSPSLLQAQRDFHYENLVTPGGKSHENVKPSGFPLEFLTLEFVHNEPPSINNYKFGAPALGLFPAMVLLLVFCLGLRLSAAVVCVSSLGAWFSLWTQFSDMSKWVLISRLFSFFLLWRQHWWLPSSPCPELVTGRLREPGVRQNTAWYCCKYTGWLFKGLARV